MSLVAAPVFEAYDHLSTEDITVPDQSGKADLRISHSLTDPEAELLEEVGLNPGHAGDVLSSGAQSIVRMYQDDTVIKLPLGVLQNDWRSRIMKAIMGQNWSQAQYEYLLCKRYLGDAIVPAQFLPGKTPGRFVGVQEYKNLERIEPAHLQQSPLFRSQMQQVLKGNGKMYEERGFALDVSGWDAPRIYAGRPYMNNVWRDEAGEICIIDTGLLDYQWHAPQILFQEWNMSKFDLDFFGKEKQ